MQIRFGDFGAIDATGYRPVQAIVTIAEADFPRLRLGEHESRDTLSPCFTWCVTRLGRGGERWVVRFAPGGVRLEFRDAADAMAFHEAWSNVVVPLAA